MYNNFTERSKFIFLLIMTAALWSTGGLLIKLINWNPIAIAGMRSAISAVILFVYLKKPEFNWSKSQIGAALAYTATVILFVSANKMTTAANTILLQFTAPIYVAIIAAVFLKEKNELIDWISVITVMAGMTLFFLDKLNLTGFWGNILAAFSGVSFALFTIFMRKQKDGSPLESVLLGNILTAIIGLPFMFGSSPGTASFIYLTILGVVQLGIPYILYSIAIKRLTALETILITVIEPILNPIWVLLLLNEVPGPWSIVGGIIVISAITIRQIMNTPSVKRKISDKRLTQKKTTVP
ncbi:MAG: DMT family transporter [Halanaerobiales bacterium]